MTAVTDCESSYPHSCTAPHPSTSSSLNHIFLSPGQTVPVTPSISPVSPLHIENALVSPIPVSLKPPPSPALVKMGLTSPQHQPQSVKSEASLSQPAFLSALTTHPIHAHTASSQNTHPPTNGSTQPLTQVIILAVMECRCLPRRCELEIKCLCVLRVALCEPLIKIISFKLFLCIFVSQKTVLEQLCYSVAKGY